MEIKIKQGSVLTIEGELKKGAHTVSNEVGAQLVRFGLATEVKKKVPAAETEKVD